MMPRSVYRFVFVLLCIPCIVLAQDSIPASPTVAEKEAIQFELLFFDALSQKAISNHRKAVELLEQCHEIRPNNVAVMFELSKNYAKLRSYIPAITFVEEALEIEPKNPWMLSHLVKIHQLSGNLAQAIVVQKQLAAQDPKQQIPLVQLYLRNNQKDKAKELLSQLETAALMTQQLRRIKQSLQRNTPKPNIVQAQTLDALVRSFETNASYATLYKILIRLEKTDSAEFLRYSQKGLELYPAQAVVYLMNARALNQNKRYKEALEQLQNGLDFVFDQPKTEALFYEEMVVSYKALGQTADVLKYTNKALTLRNKN